MNGFIFDLLRSKIYSDPIGSICREVTCNARDSMREAGKANIPIEITLPTYLSPMLHIKDNGVGISPDRMENIFVKYASSTKRNDNTQTGAFGIGAKTPFAYSDTFSIVTNFNSIKYTYSAFIDETKVGKIALIDKIPTDDINRNNYNYSN